MGWPATSRTVSELILDADGVVGISTVGTAMTPPTTTAAATPAIKGERTETFMQGLPLLTKSLVSNSDTVGRVGGTRADRRNPKPSPERAAVRKYGFGTGAANGYRHRTSLRGGTNDFHHPERMLPTGDPVANDDDEESTG
jgi:hypothetical protein